MRKKSVIIIGASPVGIQAALDFANLGIQVNLVDEAPFLGENSNGPLSPLEMNTLHLELFKHPDITLWTNTKITRLRGRPGNLKVELRQHPRFVDLQRCTACGECIDVCPVTVPGTDHKAIYLNGQPGCLVIDKLGISPCANTCPGGIQVQGYIALIAQGRFQEAIDLIRQAIPFPGICGRVCTHPCEINCRRNEIDEPVAVRLLKRFVADWELTQPSPVGKPSQHPPGLDEGEPCCQDRVAVVGAGPGGMAVASSLAQRNYMVTVYDKLPVIGGMMSVGIPSYRLPREVIDREYQQILNLGVDVQLNAKIGPDGDHTLDDLFSMGYRAICLAVGAHRSLALGITGEELKGVLHGIEVLKQINIDQDTKSFLPKGSKSRLVIIGGGNTAIDVSRSLKRLGVEDVRILYRRTRQEMPAMPEEVEDAFLEGIEIEFLVSPVRILGDVETGVSGLECIRMQLGEPDPSGRKRPVPVAGSEFVLNLDSVILAIGQNPNLDLLNPKHDIAITRDHRINIRDVDFMTSRPGVFAVGDAVTRDKMAVIEAIGMGKRAAEGIIAYLQGKSPRSIFVDSRQVPIAHRDLSEMEQLPNPRSLVPTIPLELRQTSFIEVEKGYTKTQAVAEAKRCLACGPCSECQACVQVCQPGAILHNQEETISEVKAGALVYTQEPDPGEYLAVNPVRSNLDGPQPVEFDGVFYLDGNDPFSISAVVTQTIQHLIELGKPVSVEDGFRPDCQASKEVSWIHGNEIALVKQPNRNGVFICQCGQEETGEISSIIHTMGLADQAAAWPGVIHAQVLPFSCTPEGARMIENAIQDHKLNRIVVAGCTCCSVDQVCYSCTYQRVRCKNNLNLFNQPEHSRSLGASDSAAKFIFINIREHCAWVHQDDPKAATSKAAAMIAGAVAELVSIPIKSQEFPALPRSTTILGCSSSVQVYITALEKFGIDVQVTQIPPDIIVRSHGQYTILSEENNWQTTTLVLLPQDDEEASKLMAAFTNQVYKPDKIPDNLVTGNHHNAAYIIHPASDPVIFAPAVAHRIAAWLNGLENQSQLTSIVDPSRCRACGTCIEICEFGAPGIIKYDNLGASWIDPLICRGCGICSAHCPSGAITAGYSSDAQIDAKLSALLSHPT